MNRKSFIALLCSGLAAAAVPFHKKTKRTFRKMTYKEFKHLTMSNQLKNRMLDSAFVQASLALEWVPPLK